MSLQPPTAPEGGPVIPVGPPSPDNPVSSVPLHNWYPSAKRCGCGLQLPNANLWVSHIHQLPELGPGPG